ncbi:uncharacterized protein B0H18DRAFT_1121096 [Fomitopsis serialis]|uniref:uncharacterized protein n=1 Tax=Fomitopsis serialis TaxID=139415 RepID=UPI00200725D5|nr:uncharacterized protein B0H18DRAFT_1121096 [Neoantrodia serialis]KAH9922075.1 hypothetical protein B0H18DRAFT_1121096 [Neoantrodia serialis]
MGDGQTPAVLLSRLGKLLCAPPLSIEVIPGDGSDWPSAWLGGENLQQDHRPFLYVEGHLGVPHKLLYKAYLTALREFVLLKPTFRGISDSHDDSPNAERLAQLTAVILLANPAHQTALNTRKQLVSLGLLNTEIELQFCAALLVVRECSKQSLLWHHRRWLLQLPSPLKCTGKGFNNRPEHSDTLRRALLSAVSLRAEFLIVTQACETYPRNYFAWIHRYCCLEALITLARSPTPTQDADRSLLLEEILFARTWIERHVSDYTAVHYFHNLHVLLLQEADVPLPANASAALGADRADHRTIRASLYAHAKSLLETYPEHETMWLYFRAAVHICSADPGLQLDATDVADGHSDWDAPSAPKLMTLGNAERHQAWLSRNREGSTDRQQQLHSWHR